jgi:hypothetical protein
VSHQSSHQSSPQLLHCFDLLRTLHWLLSRYWHVIFSFDHGGQSSGQLPSGKLLLFHGGGQEHEHVDALRTWGRLHVSVQNHPVLYVAVVVHQVVTPFRETVQVDE